MKEIIRSEDKEPKKKKKRQTKKIQFKEDRHILSTIQIHETSTSPKFKVQSVSDRYLGAVNKDTKTKG